MNDTFLLILTVVAFILLLSIGVGPIWSLFIISYTVLACISIMYPSGLYDWDMDKKESAGLLLTIGVVLLMIFLIYKVLTTATLPSVVLILTWGSTISMVVLFIVSLFFPSGLDKSYSWREDKTPRE